MRSLCIGSATVDIIVLVRSSDVERMTMHNATSSFLLLEQGRKFDARSITRHIGGGAVNAAVALSRLEFDSSVLVKIANDESGKAILARLEDERVDTSNVIRTDELPTGETVMVSSHDRNATIFTQRGANTLLRPEDAGPEVLSKRDLIYVSNLSNRSVECFPSIVSAGSKAGAFVAVNPGIRQITSRVHDLVASLADADLLVLNSVEAEALVPAIGAITGDAPSPPTLKLPDDLDLRLARVGLSFGGFTMDLAEFTERLRSTGLTRVAITDGVHGAYLADASGIQFCPSLPTEVKGTAGAGDAFASTLSGYLAKGSKPDAALQAAAINASSVVAEIDTQSGLLTAAKLDERAKNMTAKLTAHNLTGA